MSKIKNLVEAGIGLYGAWYFIKYYRGKLNFVGEKEEERRQRVEKYGGLIVLGTIIAVFCSIGLIISTLIHW